MSPSTEPTRPSDELDSRREPPLWILTGATASGKTALSLELAEREGLEVVSMDSMLVYRGMDVGTAKPDATERGRVPHHGLDLVSPRETYDVSRWLRDVGESVRRIESSGRRPLFVGGTGLYLQALVHGLFEGPATDPDVRATLERRADSEGAPALHAELAERDPASAERLHPNDAKRVVRALEVLVSTGRPLSDWQAEWGWHGRSRPARPHRIVGLAHPRERLDERIAERTRAMFAAGWREEVERIQAEGGFGPSAIQALGYREVLAWIEGAATEEETEARIAQKTRRFSRRQRTWFQRFPQTLWLDPDAPRLLETTLEHLESRPDSPTP